MRVLRDVVSVMCRLHPLTIAYLGKALGFLYWACQPRHLLGRQWTARADNSTLLLECAMKKPMRSSLLFSTLIAVFSLQAQAVDARSKPAAPTLSVEQRAAKKAESQARFAAMSREEKAANKGHKHLPGKPVAPGAGQGSRPSVQSGAGAGQHPGQGAQNDQGSRGR
jgi:hypothetical protein